MATTRIVFAHGSIARYLQGGGHWMCALQYLLGLKGLKNVEVTLLALLKSSGDAAVDERQMAGFFRRLETHGLEGQVALLITPPDVQDPRLNQVQVYGMGRRALLDIIDGADAVWNYAGTLKGELLRLFRHRVLLDCDPGHWQVSALEWDMGQHDHQSYLTVGLNIGGSGCTVPSLGIDWKTYVPPVYLPMWKKVRDPGPHAPFTSVTQWTWGELHHEGAVLSISKRDAYLAWEQMPHATGRPFELAANIHAEDTTGDSARLRNAGWTLADPHSVADSPSSYQDYIRYSRAEFLCPKPIFRLLRTGWFSDRSGAFLASARPVLAEDTGFSAHLPTGTGLIAFTTLEEACGAVELIDRDYALHSRVAHQLAAEYLDSARTIPAMIEAGGTA